jgi:hypothetical protein
MNWKDVLADKAKYPDDLRFTINGAEVTLGAIRQQNDASQGEIQQRLTARQQELDNVGRQQNAATDNLARIVDNVTRVTGLSVEDVVAGRIPENLRSKVQEATLRTETSAGVPFAEDPLYAPVVRELQPIRGDIGLLKQALGQSLSTYREDRARLDYLDWRTSRKLPDDFSITSKQAVDLAVSKGYKNEVGWPDVGRALDELVAPVAAKANEAEILARGVEQGRRQALAEQAASMGQPTLGGISTSTSAGGVDFSGTPAPAGERVASIREQLNKAFADPQMLTSAVQ